VPLPPLLAGALAAQAWIEGGLSDRPDPAHALLAGFGRLVRQPPARHVFVPLWSAYPAVGFGDRDALPSLRSDAADRIAGWGASVTWPAAGLALIAESARLGLRELDRLAAAAEKGRRPCQHRPPLAAAPRARYSAARAGADPKALGPGSSHAAGHDRTGAPTCRPRAWCGR
jgi:hypothetical protein